MIITEIKQGTEEWHNAKLGKIGGTRFKDVFKANNLDLIDTLISEIGSETKEESYTNSYMEWGIENEPFAKLVYQEVTGNIINDMPLCKSEWNELLLLSPDGMTKDLKGAVEIKCPATKTHCKYIRMDKIPSEYKHQIYCYFIVNEKLEWLDFVSFDYRFKPQEMFIKRITREEISEELNTLKVEYLKFYEKFKKYKNQIIN